MLIAQRPTLTEERVSDYRSRFVIEPLEPGFGYTLGNSLRRTLLSSHPRCGRHQHPDRGRPARVHHRPGRQGGRHRDHPEPQGARRLLRARRAGRACTCASRVPARSPRPTSRRRPASRCTTPTCTSPRSTARASSRWSSIVERGRGYVSAAQNKQPGQEIGRIPVDSIYSPVLKVTYKVEATRVEQRTDFDRLILDVETKPSHDARATRSPRAGKTLVELFGLARELNVDAEGIDIGPSPADALVAEQLSTPIEELDLTVRSLQLPQARGHPHRGRAHRPQRGGPAGHPQLRQQVHRRGQGEAARPGSGAQGQPRPGSTRHGRTATATRTRDYAEDEQL